ncbi:MAG: type II toxin-antitoxin system HicA family toxin [Methanosarcinales archaeon]|nr:type II toxin-antitoxin system HicA family toxin [Methanosarcinales archaeon]
MLKVPRHISGRELTNILQRYGYKITRQIGSHIRLASKLMNEECIITIPNHKSYIICKKKQAHLHNLYLL